MSSKTSSVETVQHALELDEHLPMIERGWKLQRVGWALLLLFVLAGVAGFFGDGMVSSKKVTAGIATVEFERYFRHEAEMKVVIETSEHISSLAFPQEYLKKFRVVRFVPEPGSNNTISNQVVYNFLPQDNKIVTMYLIPKDFGKTTGELRINGGNNTTLTHFIYP